MNPSAFLTHFPGKLRYWAFHCTLNSLPSFCIALWALGFWDKPDALAAMICAILTFILLYSTLTSLIGQFGDPSHTLSRALRIGTSIRATISGISLPFAFTPALMAMPDFWCGLYATGLVNQIASFLGQPIPFDDSSGMNPGFIPVYSATMIEGFILSGILLCISFVAVIILQAKDRRKFFKAAPTR